MYEEQIVTNGKRDLDVDELVKNTIKTKIYF